MALPKAKEIVSATPVVVFSKSPLSWTNKVMEVIFKQPWPSGAVNGPCQMFSLAGNTLVAATLRQPCTMKVNLFLC
ncbi:hypothetical protein V6N12_021445 [Hibiscus sabdariffa]|uniref:Uncharacterized protein n=1 Tax=Hibiscus sabdariffa TaxID=183260 RepID=A0ABR2FRN8_9ROSI